MKKHGYAATEKEKANAIGIFHHDHDLDPKIQQVEAGTLIRLMSHPMELLDMNNGVDTLFIDARSTWLQSTPMWLLENLCQKYQVFVYNSNALMLNSKWHDLPCAAMISEAITLNYIEGFLLARQFFAKSQRSQSQASVFHTH